MPSNTTSSELRVNPFYIDPVRTTPQLSIDITPFNSHLIRTCPICGDEVSKEWAESSGDVPSICPKKCCWEKFFPTRTRYDILKENSK